MIWCSSLPVKYELVCIEKKPNTSVSVQGHLPFTNNPKSDQAQ